MADMAKQLHLSMVGVTYYFRRRVPKGLAETIGRTEIRESLKTPNLAKAKKTCNVSAVVCDAPRCQHNALRRSVPG